MDHPQHVQAGYIDIYSKGGRIRRIYLPIRLRNELLDWVGEKSGFLFVNRFGEQITPRGIAQKLKEHAFKYGVNPELLADLLGHESVDTTRIYLQRSGFEQKKIIDRVVDW